MDLPGSDAVPPGGSRGRAMARFALFLLFLAAAFYAAHRTGLASWVTRARMEAMVADFGLFRAALVYVAVYAVGTVMAVPGTLLTILGGVVFGSWLGTGLVVVGATLGATGSFLVARYLARGMVEELFGRRPWFARLDRGIAEHGIYFVLFIRLVPLFPFNGLNYATGLTAVRLRDYVLGTFVGIAPASFVFANAAARAADAATEGLTWEFVVSLVLLALLALLPLLYHRVKRTAVHHETPNGQ